MVYEVYVRKCFCVCFCLVVFMHSEYVFCLVCCVLYSVCSGLRAVVCYVRFILCLVCAHMCVRVCLFVCLCVCECVIFGAFCVECQSSLV